MTPADQTTFGIHRYPFAPGDCLSACVATLLDLPTHAVPIFVDSNDSNDEMWAGRMADWLAPLGLTPMHCDPREPVEGFYILYGRSVRGREHAVVARGGCVVHDPHPSRTGLVSVERAIALV